MKSQILIRWCNSSFWHDKNRQAASGSMGCGSSQSSPTDPIAASVAIQPRDNTINNFLLSLRHPVIQQPCSVICAGLEFSKYFRINYLKTCFPSQHQIHSDDPKEVMLRVQQLLLQQLPSPRAGLQNTNLLKVSLGLYTFVKKSKIWRCITRCRVLHKRPPMRGDLMKLRVKDLQHFLSKRQINIKACVGKSPLLAFDQYSTLSYDQHQGVSRQVASYPFHHWPWHFYTSKKHLCSPLPPPLCWLLFIQKHFRRLKVLRIEYPAPRSVDGMSTYFSINGD